jgi:hypothetical protein
LPRTFIGRQHDVLAHGEVRPQVEGLEHHPEPRPEPHERGRVDRLRPGRQPGHVDLDAVDRNAAGLGRLEEVHAAQEGAFPGPGRARIETTSPAPADRLTPLET